MAAANGGIPSEEIKNYFNSIQSPFPIPVNGKIDTIQFLEASRGVVSLIEQFGNVFAPVKCDMTGNIDKLMQVYYLDQNSHSNLNNMVLLERSAQGILATDALLWLRRALHLIQRFFEMILEDNQATGGITEDLGPFLKAAYIETLKKYHNWSVQLLFSMLSRMRPNRSKLVQVMSLNRPQTEATVYRDMAAFTERLGVNISTLTAFYKEHQLENEAKV